MSPLIKAKDDAHLRMIQCNISANQKEFRRYQSKVKVAVDNAKEEWICRVAKEREAEKKDDCTRWKSIRKLQLAHAGRRPTRPTAVMKENGRLTQGPEEVRARWHQHFVKILNIPYAFNDEVIDTLPVLPPHLDLDMPPTEEKSMRALTKLKMRKAGRKSGVLPELIFHGGVDLWDRMLEVMQKVWEEGKVVRDWQDAVVVPIPKKGDLKQCDHWRGISLLDVVGKVLGRIVQERLQVIAENILPESQSGFRKERGCADMIFVTRQLVEKAREHGESLYVLFVDLRKAYDSVPRQSLWKVLEKYGVPEKMLNIVKSFHEGMYAC